ncbi:unnamed protein product, partial [Ectocarpus sp. 8 AP-2014]
SPTQVRKRNYYIVPSFRFAFSSSIPVLSLRWVRCPIWMHTAAQLYARSRPGAICHLSAYLEQSCEISSLLPKRPPPGWYYRSRTRFALPLTTTVFQPVPLLCVTVLATPRVDLPFSETLRPLQADQRRGLRH